jgi:hypothetical protein
MIKLRFCPYGTNRYKVTCGTGKDKHFSFGKRRTREEAYRLALEFFQQKVQEFKPSKDAISMCDFFGKIIK